ncbi:MAG: hypothetical protein ACFFCS_15880 [Candidatus Hodarchaeota archaeon]
MGFKKITAIELKTKDLANLIGMPMKHVEQISEKVSTKLSLSQINKKGKLGSKILVANEEFMQFTYDYSGTQKNVEGMGTISITNTSHKDRIWDARLEIGSTKYSNLESGSEMKLGILEPLTSKRIKYNIMDDANLPDMVELSEKISVSNSKITETEIMKDMGDIGSVSSGKSAKERNQLLVFGEENLITFDIALKNVSNSDLQDIKVSKQIPKNYNNLKVNSEIHKDININGNLLLWSIQSLKIGESTSIKITLKLLPKKREAINTGSIELNCKIEALTISQTEINDFSAYSHARHTIITEELENKPNTWSSQLVMENHSDLLIELKSISIMDKSKTKNLMNFNASGGSITIKPGLSYNSQKWEICEENEPKFVRKLEYSVAKEMTKECILNAKYGETIFDIVDVQFDDVMSDTEIKSFEEIDLENTVVIKNTGTKAIQKIVLKTTVPKGFLPPYNASDIQVKSMQGAVEDKNLIVTVSPQNEDINEEHVLEILIDFEENKYLAPSLNLENFLEVKYGIKAIAPDNKQKYEFPLELYSYFPKYSTVSKEAIKEFYVFNEELMKDKRPTLNVIHKRRKISIGKEIFPGRTTDEFAISLVVRNESSADLENFTVTDSIPISFELVSSNVKHEIIAEKDKDITTISFTIEKISSYQEREIMYYLKNKSEADISYSELESYLLG